MKRYILLVLYYYCEGKTESNMVNYQDYHKKRAIIDQHSSDNLLKSA